MLPLSHGPSALGSRPGSVVQVPAPTGPEGFVPGQREVVPAGALPGPTCLSLSQACPLAGGVICSVVGERRSWLLGEAVL